MRRIALVLALFVTVAASGAPEKWTDAYDRGVKAVNARNYKVAAEALQKAIAEMPNEASNVRVRNTLITYVPHFWLGIARLNLGDADGALREWRISEEQGVVARTDYYARMKDWIARAQDEKTRNADTAAAGPRKAADTASSHALELQLDALSAGGDRSDKYLAAQRKLQEARSQFQKSGNDVSAYRVAEQTAQQAAALFTTAADDAKKQKLARAAAPPRARQAAPVQQAPVMPQPAAGNVPLKAAVQTAAPEAQAAPPTVVSEAEATKRISEQNARRKEVETKPAVPAAPSVRRDERIERADLQKAWRSYAAGDPTASESQLTRILSAAPVAEAFLLRGCARYTRAMLSRKPDPLLHAAREDFRAALARDRALRLDRRTFPPKLVAFFESVRASDVR